MHARAARGTGIRRTAPLSDFQPLCCVCPRSTKGILFIGCPLFIHAAEGRTAYMTCEGAGAPGGSDRSRIPLATSLAAWWDASSAALSAAPLAAWLDAPSNDSLAACLAAWLAASSVAW